MTRKTDHKRSAEIISLAGQKRRRAKQKAVHGLRQSTNKIIWLLLIVSGAALAYWFAITPPAPPNVLETINGRVRYVVDGDSLYLNGHKPQIRLWGVDAPEKAEAGFQAATDHLTQIAKGRFLKCRKIDTDKYGRTVARCFLRTNREINRMMIESGTASEYLRFSNGFYRRSKP